MTPAPPRPARLPWRRKLEGRLVLSVTLVVGLSLVAVLAATGEAVTELSQRRSAQDLVGARAAFNRLVDARAEFASAQARLIVELPIFRDPLTNEAASRHTETMNQMVEPYCAKLGAALCTVTNPAGEWLGRAGAITAPSAEAAMRPVIDVARAGTGASHRTMVIFDGSLYLIVAEPARFADEVLGVFAVAYPLDDAIARELALVTHCDVTFVCEEGRLCGSSLAPEPRAQLSTLLATRPDDLGPINAGPSRRRLGEFSYIGGRYALGATPAAAGLVLLQDWTPTEDALRGMDLALALIGVAVFAVALAGALVFSRRLTRPLQQVATAANAIAGGDWQERVPVSGPAEARIVAEAFNHMTITLGHWHAQANARAGELQEAYDRFRSVTDSANDAIISINGQGEIIFWSRRAASVFGRTSEDVLKTPLVSLLAPKAQTEYRMALAALAESSGRGVARTVELMAIHASGAEVPVELSLSTWQAGPDVFYTAVMRDITERKQAAQVLREREDQLRQAQKMEAVGRLAGGVAHDFNNLLTAILGYADLLLEQLPRESAWRTEVLEIQHAGRDAASLTRDLLAFGRKQVLQPVALDLNEVVRTTENMLRRLLGADLELVCALDPAGVWVQVDRNQMSHALINLAVNARDAMPGGGRLTIRTAADADDPPGRSGRLGHLIVSDTGHGMSDEVRAHIFEPFFTTKDIGKGTGLGLATVYGMVTQSGGHIGVDSAPGQGASFDVSLPLVEAPADAQAPAAGIAPVMREGSETVLLVEDNAAVRRLAVDALERRGYTVIEATHGQDALDRVGDTIAALDLVVTDVVMPVMGGREMVARLRARRPDLGIIFTSGYAQDARTSFATPEPGVSYIHKPFSPAALCRAVRELLDGVVRAPE